MTSLRMDTTTRVWWVDLLRGLACLSMPFYHIVYNLHGMGFTTVAYNKTTFWQTWQVIGLSTFILVSGMAFMLSTQKGIRWHRLGRRVLKLGMLAGVISLATWFAMPDKFVRFGVLHFFTMTIVLAPVFYKFPFFGAITGVAVIGFYQWMGKPGLWPEGWLYFSGMMSERPRSMDYVPLIPWFGVFLIGLAVGSRVNTVKERILPPLWAQPVIWLGQHSLSFYFLHQALIYSLMFAIQRWW